MPDTAAPNTVTIIGNDSFTGDIVDAFPGSVVLISYSGAVGIGTSSRSIHKGELPHVETAEPGSLIGNPGGNIHGNHCIGQMFLYNTHQFTHSGCKFLSTQPAALLAGGVILIIIRFHEPDHGSGCTEDPCGIGCILLVLASNACPVLANIICTLLTEIGCTHITILQPQIPSGSECYYITVIDRGFS